MEAFKNFVHTHAIGLAFAFFVGACAVIPSLVPPILLGADYHGIAFVANNDENAYRARIHEILDGHLAVGSTNLYEHKDDKGVIPPIHEYLYAIPAFFFGLSGVIVFSKFLLPALLFFLVYRFVRSLGGEGDAYSRSILVWTAVAAGLFASFGLDAGNIHQQIDLLKGTHDAFASLSWTRLVNPIIGALEILVFFLALLKVWKEKHRKATIVAGLTMALSVGYFFGFGIIACTLGAAGLAALFLRDMARVVRLATIGVIGIVCSLPYWILALSAASGEEGRILSERNGMYFTHDAVVNKFLLLTTVFTLLSFCYAYFYKRYRDELSSWGFVFIVLSGSWIALNQQVITGRAIWYYHFAQYTMPIGFIVLAVVGYLVWRRQFPRFYRVALTGGIVVSALLLVLTGLSYRYGMGDFKALQQHGDLFSFLNNEAPKDCVVFIKEESDPAEPMIPAYTHCNVYSTIYLFNGVPRDRTLHNFLLRMRLEGVTEADMHQYLLAHEPEIRHYFFDNWDQIFASGIDSWVEGRIVMLEDAYRPFLKEDMKREMLMYRMDYFAVREPLPPSLFQQLPGLSLLKRFPDYYVYTFAVVE